MDQETIEQVSEVLAAAVDETVQQLGRDVAMALLIHYLHEVSLRAPDAPAAEAS